MADEAYNKLCDYAKDQGIFIIYSSDVINKEEIPEDLNSAFIGSGDPSVPGTPPLDGLIVITERKYGDRLNALLAHELGHAITRKEHLAIKIPKNTREIVGVTEQMQKSEINAWFAVILLYRDLKIDITKTFESELTFSLTSYGINVNSVLDFLESI